MAAILVLLGGVIPAYVGAWTDDGSAVTVAVHLAVLVALIMGLVIAVRNDIEHARREHGRQVILEERFAHPVDSAGAVNDDDRSRELEPVMEKERVRRVDLRIRRWQVPAGFAILLTSGLWLLAHLT